jgi:hypothetical protein
MNAQYAGIDILLGDIVNRLVHSAPAGTFENPVA